LLQQKSCSHLPLKYRYWPYQCANSTFRRYIMFNVRFYHVVCMFFGIPTVLTILVMMHLNVFLNIVWMRVDVIVYKAGFLQRLFTKTMSCDTTIVALWYINLLLAGSFYTAGVIGEVVAVDKDASSPNNAITYSLSTMQFGITSNGTLYNKVLEHRITTCLCFCLLWHKLCLIVCLKLTKYFIT